MRGRSYTPSPPRGYGRRGRSPSPRGRYGGRARDLPTSLLVRNLRHDCRPEDLRRPFERFGPLKDIYLPKDYYTGLAGKCLLFHAYDDLPYYWGLCWKHHWKREPRGFGFVQYVDPADAAEAKYQMDGQVLLGRELTVVFAEENRKKPAEMRHRERARKTVVLSYLSTFNVFCHRGGRYRDRRRSPPRYSCSPRYSRSPPRHGRYRSRSRDYPPPKDRHYSRSVSPQDGHYSRDRYSRSPPYNVSRSCSRSLERGQGPSQGRSRSPRRSRSHSPREAGSPIRSRSRSRSPYHEEYKRELNGERSPSQ
ncbi:hypothetical protein CXB51_014261 [Gossypium anomalum]|uniref:RRM domain-containing protein n=1 Tax=Gossypium anomalum TaxID=47600 RepID=A0A8J6D0A4_9ROSI|nr:hypothetical protein CXB51_014261 [Gossypium anomalum]